MRLFVDQTNIITTSRITDKITGEVADSLNITVNLYNGETKINLTSDEAAEEDDFGLELAYIGDGAYRGKMPVIDILDETLYDIEMIIKSGDEVVWYFKGPVRAIIRKVMS